MRRVLTAFTLLALAGCGGDDAPTAPAPAGPVVFTAPISASRAVPAVAGAEANGAGTVRITLNPTRDGDGIVTGGTIDVVVDLTGYPAGTQVTAAAIRVGGAAANGVSILDTGLAARGGATLDSGSGTINLTNVPVSGPVANALLANIAGYYFNVQSALNPTTAARGQLAFQ